MGQKEECRGGGIRNRCEVSERQEMSLGKKNRGGVCGVGWTKRGIGIRYCSTASFINPTN